MISISLSVNTASGTTRTVQVEQGTTLGDLLDRENLSDSTKYSARVNRREVDTDEELQDGDRISVTPEKVTGNIA